MTILHNFIEKIRIVKPPCCGKWNKCNYPRLIKVEKELERRLVRIMPAITSTGLSKLLLLRVSPALFDIEKIFVFHFADLIALSISSTPRQVSGEKSWKKTKEQMGFLLIESECRSLCVFRWDWFWHVLFYFLYLCSRNCRKQP